MTRTNALLVLLKVHWKSLLVVTGVAVTCCLLALNFGRDVPWDYHNYHAYAAYSLIHDRLERDFFAAGLQGYLNPIGLAPLALTQSLGLSGMATEVMLAAIHSLNAFLLYLISRTLAVGKTRTDQVAMAIGWLIGASTPVFLIHLGSTFVDPVGSVLVMASVYLAISKRTTGSTVICAALAGLSVAMKLSNAPFAIAIAITLSLPWRNENTSQWLVRIGLAALGMVGGFLIAQGYWSWRLQQVMGNPFFPFFNNIFESPYFTTGQTGSPRFEPMGLLNALSMPLRIAKAESWTYIELLAPTSVPLVLCILGVIAALTSLLRKTKPNILINEPVLRLATFVIVSSILWIATSSNGRYAIPLFLLFGPLTALISLYVMPRRYALTFLSLLACQQIFAFSYDGVARWGSTKWTPQLMPVVVPQSLKQRPHLLISVSSPSYSDIIPFIHPDSVFVNLRGAYSIPSSGASNEKLQALITKFDDRTEILFALPRLEGLKPDIAALIRYYSAFVDRVGLKIDLKRQCKNIHLDSQPPLISKFNQQLGPSMPITVLSCSAIRIHSSADSVILRERAAKIIDAFEKKCPQLFLPHQVQIEGAGHGWGRSYYNRDGISLFVRFDKDAIIYALSGQTSSTRIGKPSNWQAAVESFNCELPGNGDRGIKFFEENEDSAVWD